MNYRLQNISKIISSKISIGNFMRLTGQHSILPFYHTVFEEPSPHFSEIAYNRSRNFFLKDLNFFCEHFKSVGIKDFSLPGKNFHLSFDDGMREIFSVVYPILKERNIHASIFINSDFVDNKKMFLSHKKSLIVNYIRTSEHDKKVVSGHLKVGETLVLPSILKMKDERLLNDIAKLIKIDFEEYLQQYRPYLSTGQILKLIDEGFTIGNHSKSHRRFHKLDFERQKKEVLVVNELLKSFGIKDLYFAFPYGDHKIKNEFFEWMFNEGEILSSFGISGLKTDSFSSHKHRILMEHEDLSAEEIIKYEYFYFMLKFIFRRNSISR